MWDNHNISSAGFPISVGCLIAQNVGEGLNLFVFISACQVVDEESEETKRDTKHYINFDLTIKDVISKIVAGFPKTFKECDESDFAAKSRTFVNSLVFDNDKLELVLNTIQSHCTYCDHPLDDWKHKGATQ